MKKLNLLVIAIVFTIGLRAQSVQQLLNSGVSLQEILTVIHPTYPTDSVYDRTYQGGIIFYLYRGSQSGFRSWTGYVAAPADQTPINAGVPWSLTAKFLLSYGYSYTNDNYNQNLIVNNQGPGNYAAYLCDTLNLNGYNDWYLPTGGALEIMRSRLHCKNYGNFQDSAYYWSSTEVANTTTTFNPLDTVYARSVRFIKPAGATGTSVTKYKLTDFLAVRAIRTFAPSTITTSINKLTTNTKTKTYPNPVVNTLTVEVDAESTYSLFSVDGRLVSTGTFSEGKNTIETSDLPLGTYLLDVKNSRSVTYSKIIKK